MPDDMVAFWVVFFGVGALLAAAFDALAASPHLDRDDFARRCCLQERPWFESSKAMVAPSAVPKS
tara:strand:- start:302 stop:496 length:195 start_codon:yes stop_codon:yes gene_type:complete